MNARKTVGARAEYGQKREGVWERGNFFFFFFCKKVGEKFGFVAGMSYLCHRFASVSY